MIVFFVLGMMAKPMLMTLPAVLLLLDYWPLGRMGRAPAVDGAVAADGLPGGFRVFRSLVVEKLPLFLVAAIFFVVTVWTQGASLVEEHLPISWRVANALVAYVTYLGQFFCPRGLAVFYPHPGTHLPIWNVVGAAVVLTGISATVLRMDGNAPTCSSAGSGLWGCSCP